MIRVFNGSIRKFKDRKPEISKFKIMKRRNLISLSINERCIEQINQFYK